MNPFTSFQVTTDRRIGYGGVRFEAQLFTVLVPVPDLFGTAEDAREFIESAIAEKMGMGPELLRIKGRG
jgi:hypothetical protein